MTDQWGKYRLNKLLAKGGMAEVFLADLVGPSGFLKPVCLKRIRSEFSGDTAFKKMFESEARIAATLHHPNVVEVFDFDIHENQLFLTMEIVDGIDVATILERVRRLGLKLPIGFSCYVMHGLFNALGYAHSQTVNATPRPVIHRDVSPHNVLVSKDGIVKLADFGIAKAKGLSDETQAGLVKGKVSYLSPEQARAKRLNTQTDLFSAGLVFYELITNRRAFHGATDTDILLQIAEANVPFIPYVPDGLNDFINKITSRDPANRHRDANRAIASMQALGIAEMDGVKAGALVRTLIDYEKTFKAPSSLATDNTVLADQEASEIKGKIDPRTHLANESVAPPAKSRAQSPTPAARPSNHERSAGRGASQTTDPNLYNNKTTSSGEIPIPKIRVESPKHRTKSFRLAGMGLGAVVVVALVLWFISSASESTHEPSDGATEGANPTAESSNPMIHNAGEMVGVSPEPKTTTPRVTTLRPENDVPASGSKTPEPKSEITPYSASNTAPTPSPSKEPSQVAVKTGYLEVNVRPWANVLVNGNNRGTTPLTKIRLKTGTHRITLINSELGYKKRLNVKIRSGKTTSVNEKIPPNN